MAMILGSGEQVEKGLGQMEKHTEKVQFMHHRGGGEECYTHFSHNMGTYICGIGLLVQINHVF